MTHNAEHDGRFAAPSGLTGPETAPGDVPAGGSAGLAEDAGAGSPPAAPWAPADAGTADVPVGASPAVAAADGSNGREPPVAAAGDATGDTGGDAGGGFGAPAAGGRAERRRAERRRRGRRASVAVAVLAVAASGATVFGLLRGGEDATGAAAAYTVIPGTGPASLPSGTVTAVASASTGPPATAVTTAPATAVTSRPATTRPATTPADAGASDPSRLAPGARASYGQVESAMRADGITLTLTSGRRSYEHQRELWEEEVRDKGSEDEARMRVLPPEESSHVRGVAIDIAPAAAQNWLEANGRRYGWCRVYDNEPWHFEYAPSHRSGCPARKPHP